MEVFEEVNMIMTTENETSMHFNFFFNEKFSIAFSGKREF